MSALWTIDAMAAAMRADKSGALPAEVPGLSIDSRSVAKGEAFFAITGDNRDGHDFVETALKAGAGLAVVARSKRAQFAAEAPLLAVDDVLGALSDLARAARARSDAKVDRRHRLGRQDQHQGGLAPCARRRRRDPCLGRLLQQSLGRAAFSGPMSGERQIRGIRDRHEPCRRDHAAHQIGAPACGDRHDHRAGASGIFRHAHENRRRQGGDLRRHRAGRRRRAQSRQPPIRPSRARPPRPPASRASCRSAKTPRRTRGCCVIRFRPTARPSRRAFSGKASPTSSARPASTWCSIRWPCWRPPRWPAPTWRWRRSRSTTSSRPAGAAAAPPCASPAAAPC